MRRALVAIPLVVLAAAVPVSALAGHPAAALRSVAPQARPLPGVVTLAGHGARPRALLPLQDRPLLPRSVLALLGYGRPDAIQGGVPGSCFRDSPGAPCVLVCHEAVADRPRPLTPPHCPTRPPAAHVYPVAAAR